MPLHPWVALSACVFALASTAAPSTAGPPGGDKLAAVDKAIDLLESLQQAVLKEGENEAKTYNQFACFCKDTTTDKLAAITKGEDDKSELEGESESLETDRDSADTKIHNLQGDIATLAFQMKQATAARRGTEVEYEKNSADVRLALTGLEGAIQSVKASKSPSFLEVKSVSATLRTAVALADALGLVDTKARSTLAFMQEDPPANEVQMEDYKFHSDDIISTLERLQKQFLETKNDLDKAEVQSIQDFEVFMQEKTHETKMKNRELSQTRKHRADLISDIATTAEQLSTVEATLRDDQQYTNELTKMCTDKAKTWDQRKRTRLSEVATLTEAISTLKTAVKPDVTANTIRFMQKATSLRVANLVAANPGAMAAIEEAADEADAAPSLVQMRQGSLRASRRHGGDGRDAIAEVLKSSGNKLQSTLLTALASRIAADPFAKVKQLIQELIERLLQEASTEATQKGWCDKSIADAKQKRDYAAEEIADLNSQLEKLEALIGQLTQDLHELSEDIAKLYKVRNETSEERDAESRQNNATIVEAQTGLDALKLCIQTLDRFYKTIAKETVDLSLAQQGPRDDAPDAGFKIGEAYTGQQGAAVGILGMLDVMKSDFVRTILETQAAEEQAQRDFIEFLTTTGSSLAQKQEAEESTKSQKADAEDKDSSARSDLQSQQGLLISAIKELKDLQPVCIDTGMSYNDRVSKREEEIKSLNKALCIFGNYEKYGPDGASSGC